LALVLNATPLIYLSRSGGLRFLKALNATIYAPRAVYDEVVVEGRRLGKPGAELVDRYVEEGVITIRGPSDKRKVSSLMARSQEVSLRPLSEGEAEVLALALELNCTAIIDEHLGRSVARLYGISVHGTTYLLILAHRAGALTKKEVIALFKRMVGEGWRISVEDYTVIMEELEKL